MSDPLIAAIIKAREILEQADIPTEDRYGWIVNAPGVQNGFYTTRRLSSDNWYFGCRTAGNAIAREKCLNRRRKK